MRIVLFMLTTFISRVFLSNGFLSTKNIPKNDILVLYARKHLNSYQTRRDSDEIKDTVVLDPKKVALLEKLGLNDEQDSQSILKTGAELRSERKNVLKAIRDNDKHKIKSAAKSAKAMKPRVIPEKPIRFALGCGIETLTATNLLDLVKFTAPYLFPESGPRVTIEEDDDFDDLDSFSASYTPADDRLAESLIKLKSVTDKDEYISPSSTLSISVELNVADMTAVEKSAGPSGWYRLLKNSNHIPNTNTPNEAQRIDYFALCMASHFCTVATYCPTDVDSKIRGHCWMDPSEEVIYAQFQILKNALFSWDVDAVSKRNMMIRGIDKDRPISGHDGEWLGVLGGAWGAFLRFGNKEMADEVEGLMNDELHREAAAFRYVRGLEPSVASDTALLKLSAILTHNVGDVDQGLNYWQMNAEGISAFETQKLKFSRLAHERNERFGGEFFRAKIIYKELLSAEGHRHYPLREPKCLRMTPDLMLPLGLCSHVRHIHDDYHYIAICNFL